MLAIHDQFTRQMRNRLETTAIGLGLVRLLQDARRFEEAKTILYTLENSFQGVEAEKHSQKPYKTNQLKGVSKTASCSSGSASTKIDAAEMLTQPLSIA